MEQSYEALENSLITIASETFRLKRIFEKATDKLDAEKAKYMSQFSWFEKRVNKAFEEAGLSLINLEGELYDPGMALSPMNIDDFEADDILFVAQMITPIIMKNTELVKMGTAMLGRVTK